MGDRGAWQQALAQPHGVVSRATLLTDVDESPLDGLEGGNVSLDSTADSRGRCDLTFVGEENIPHVPTDSLTPYGNQIKVERGIVYPDGSEELISLGKFRIDEVELGSTPSEASIRVTGIDRSIIVADAKFEEPFEVEAGTLFTELILEVLTDALPSIETNFAETSVTTPKLVAEAGDDRWAFVSGLAEAIGAELYFDGDGICVLRPVPQIAAMVAADVELVEGEEGVLVSAGKVWSRAGEEGAFNRVIVTGENSSQADVFRAVATDLNPESPTYYYGKFGKVPRFETSEFVTSNEQAQTMANAILAQELGTTTKVGFGSVVDPSLEPSDIAQITREDTGIDEIYIIDDVTIPLDPETSMSGNTRAQLVEGLEDA